jgi:hypothetical protein
MTDWEKVAKRKLKIEAETVSHDAHEQAGRVAEAFERGELEDTDIRRFRNTLARMMNVIEEEIIGRHPEFTAYSDGDPYIRNYGMIADYLDVEFDQLSEFMAGQTATVNAAAVSDLAAGDTVTVETEAGTEVTLDATDAVDVQAGP